MLLFNIYILAVIAVSKCSKELRTMEPFVVGGDYVKIENFPHAAFLGVTVNKGYWMCGGVILNQILILTAAHCLSECYLNKRNNRIDVYVGHEDIKKVTIVRSVKRFIVHERYDDPSAENDIGLIILDKEIPFGRTVKRCILTRYPSYDVGFVAGWGLENDETEYTSKKLKSVSQPIKPKSTCKISGDLEPGMLCAGSLIKGASRPSAGDSGSGLVNKKNQLLGIVSWRNDRFPGLLVYTNASYYYNWIVKTAQKLYCMIKSIG